MNAPLLLPYQFGATTFAQPIPTVFPQCKAPCNPMSCAQQQLLAGPSALNLGESSSQASQQQQQASTVPVNNAERSVELICEWNSCERVYTAYDSFLNHVTEHVNQQSDNICRWRNCDRDSKSFAAHYMLVLHVRKHTGEKPNECHASLVIY